jgi:hypothetical protein
MTRGTQNSGAVLLQKLKLPQSTNSPHVMVHKGPSPHPQQPATCPYPKPHEFRPRPPTIFLWRPFNITLPSTPRSSQRSLSYRFPLQPNTLYINVFSHMHATSPACLTSLHFSHISASNTNRDAPQHAILSNLPSVPLPQAEVPQLPRYPPAMSVLMWQLAGQTPLNETALRLSYRTDKYTFL